MAQLRLIADRIIGGVFGMERRWIQTVKFTCTALNHQLADYLIVVRCASLLAELSGGIVLAQGNAPPPVAILMAVLVFGFGLLEQGFGLLVVVLAI
jgi:hypothetical protein